MKLSMICIFSDRYPSSNGLPLLLRGNCIRRHLLCWWGLLEEGCQYCEEKYRHRTAWVWLLIRAKSQWDYAHSRMVHTVVSRRENLHVVQQLRDAVVGEGSVLFSHEAALLHSWRLTKLFLPRTISWNGDKAAEKATTEDYSWSLALQTSICIQSRIDIHPVWTYW